MNGIDVVIGFYPDQRSGLSPYLVRVAGEVDRLLATHHRFTGRAATPPCSPPTSTSSRSDTPNGRPR